MKPVTPTHLFRLLLPLVLLAVLFGAAAPARAVEIDNDGTVAAGEVVDDDLILSGEKVTMDGTVNGILIASGGEVTINGTVNGDLIVNAGIATINGTVSGNVFAAGNQVEINGPVEGTVFAAGYSVALGPEAAVERNLFAAGFGVRTEAGSTVGRDAFVAGYQAVLGGEIARDLKAGASALEIDGRIGRNVAAEVGEPGPAAQAPSFTDFPGAASVQIVAPGLRVSEGAQIGGKLHYVSPAEQAGAIRSLPEGGVEFVLKQVDKVGKPPESIVTRLGQQGLDIMRNLVTLLALGALAVWLAPTLLDRLVEKARAAPLPAAGWGFVTVVVGYIGAGFAALTILVAGILLGIVTLGGLAGTVFGVGFSGLGLAFAAFAALVSYGSKIVVSFLGGRLILQRLAPQYAERKFWPLAVGVVIYVILRAIPFLGWLFGVAVTIIGVGAMWLLFREWRASRSQTQLAPTA
ncbi:MAG: polymer-forming cytoskeletal protein [Chloroflexi bacterium]|nr:polymer-forming cytoskeletal protein [Chloroflexota bacterium]MBI5829858.1 polymer-forming cytoskeletal protein [Chloroflexota bacterium]